ncbi:hypothetical protein M0765_002865 [Variovorax sp. S2]|uniref:DUF7661 family protein n=1 Tax=Variovorax sp. S12S4 TaxID=3029170 RepID=UPI00215CF4AE|nr:hypothetical protein [Variovorax sp. S12S4]MCR8956712.1 hypothetical protein [Variovorax sp. S12S4]
MRYRFNVFGRIIAIERVGDAWAAHLAGDDGKRRPAGLAIPSDVPHAELAQYLYDIYHESATPTNGDVFEIEPRGQEPIETRRRQ